MNKSLNYAIFYNKEGDKNNVKKIKTGAMFGLDARIALAIFGAISIITGAMLYNAMQIAKAEALRTNLEELGKAFTAYKLDTQTYFPYRDGVFIDKLGRNLFKNCVSAANWKGPYFKEGSPGYDCAFSGSDRWFRVPPPLDVFGTTTLCTYSIAEPWGGGDGDEFYSSPGYCNSNPITVRDCYVHFKGQVSSSNESDRSDVFNAFLVLDKLVDNNDGPRRGKVKIMDNGTTTTFLYVLFPDEAQIHSVLH